ncbi:hypothetical protein DSECCO2_568940 [anaerobic digester metagenome]
MHLGPAGQEALGGVRLGRAGCAAATVAPGLAAEQQHNVTGLRLHAHDVFSRGGCNDRTHLHALGHIAGMVYLMDKAGRKADLVAIGGIARRRLCDNFTLRQLARHRLGNGLERIGGTRDAHGLINIASARERVANRAAQTGGSPAERLDLSRVVMRFVFKHQEPVFVTAVDVHLDFDRAGVDLLRLVKVGQQAALF